MMEEYYHKKYLEAVDQENWEQAEYHDKKYTKIVGEQERTVIQNVLLIMLVVTLSSPFWLFLARELLMWIYF